MCLGSCVGTDPDLASLAPLLWLDILGIVHLHRLPSLHLLVGFFFRNAIPFLYFADELVPLARDDRQVVSGKLAPLFLDSPLRLIPFPFGLFPIHGVLLSFFSFFLATAIRTKFV